MPRPVGSKNRPPKTALLGALQARYPGFNPAIEMAHIVMKKTTNDEGDVVFVQSDRVRFEMFEKILQYIEPKLKQVDVNADVKHTGDITINITSLTDSKDGE